MSTPVTSKVPFGGDYNPEQWPETVWARDYELFDAAGIDTVTLGVFDWAMVQPAAEVYDFSTLDRIVDLASERGRNICMATGTGAHPAWMAKAFPEVTRPTPCSRTSATRRPPSGSEPGAGHDQFHGRVPTDRLPPS